jgi:hypothetical protein
VCGGDRGGSSIVVVGVVVCSGKGCKIPLCARVCVRVCARLLTSMMSVNVSVSDRLA